MKIKKINIFHDFSATPAGRTIADDAGNSGEALRKNFLVPAINDKDIETVEIDLTGLPGVGSFFWEEAFGGMIRNKEVNYETAVKKLKFIANDNVNTIPNIQEYMRDAFEKLNK